MSRAWAETVPDRQRQQAAWAFIKTAIERYAEVSGRGRIAPPDIAFSYRMGKSATELARIVGEEVAELPIEFASYHLSTTYTALVPPNTRSALGMYYTPPALTARLLDMAEESGVDWANADVLDPACGGGAFLLPVALRMRKALAHLPLSAQREHLLAHLRGFEIDPFAAWLTQTWLDIALSDLWGASAPGKPIVRVCDTLEQEPKDRRFDLVVGNPPYGRVALTPEQRTRFGRSLFGHANIYGVFTDIGLRWAKERGIIAYVTPTSFLAGGYFKALRQLLAEEAPPVAIDFINARRGVFEDVLQETLLATYQRAGKSRRARVHYVEVGSETSATVTHAGTFSLPAESTAPWLAPRSPRAAKLVARLTCMPNRLSDWGYRVSTGPLVWNRFKDQLRDLPTSSTYPLIWAESVSAEGRFAFRADKRGHRPYFHATPRDEWLKVRSTCILVQRTTAKEQRRRLIAAELPASFIKRHGAVIVENHLNMVRPCAPKSAQVCSAAVAALLNSPVADDAFRCISGSVAVSAFELEALPLPSVAQMKGVERLIETGAKPETIDAYIHSLYFGEN